MIGIAGTSPSLADDGRRRFQTELFIGPFKPKNRAQPRGCPGVWGQSRQKHSNQPEAILDLVDLVAVVLARGFGNVSVQANGHCSRLDLRVNRGLDVLHFEGYGSRVRFFHLSYECMPANCCKMFSLVCGQASWHGVLLGAFCFEK